jgi:hypothetical protein
LPIELGLSESAVVGEQEAGLVYVQVEDLFIIFEHDSNCGKVIEGVFVQGGFLFVVGIAGEELPLEDDGDQDVLGGGHELQLHLLAGADEEEELDSLEVLRREILEYLLNDLRLDLGSEASGLIFLHY